MTKKTLGSLRVEEATLEHMRLAINKHNSKSISQLSESEFRRFAYELLAQLIIQDIPLPVKITQ